MYTARATSPTIMDMDSLEDQAKIELPASGNQSTTQADDTDKSEPIKPMFMQQLEDRMGQIRKNIIKAVPGSRNRNLLQNLIGTENKTERIQQDYALQGIIKPFRTQFGTPFHNIGP